MSKPQLFCFTYAGGSASFFDVIEKDLPEIDVMKPEYSGHGTRHKDSFYQDFAELADDVYEQVCSMYSGGKYALFGYSMGTISLVEVLRRIRDKKEIPFPNHIFLAAHEPLTKAIFAGYNPEELDSLIKERTIKFGTVPEKLVNNNSFWRVYLPLYRADYTILGKYKFENLDLVSEIPTTVFYSGTDTKYEDMKLWTNFFVGECEFHEYDGTHFFIQQHHAEMARIIQDRLNGGSDNDF